MDRDASSPSAHTLADQLAAAQDWWRDAGVDQAFSDATASWLREPEEEAAGKTAAAPPQRVEVQSAPQRPKIGGETTSWPQTLEAFAHWWLTEPSLDSGGARPRIAPRGRQGAKLMVLVPEPEAEDSEMLLSGPKGRLLKNFLAAAGIDEAETYLAAVLPRHTPHPDWAGLAMDGLGTIVLHHVALAAPERLLVFGRDILPLIGHDPAQSPASLPEINHHGGSTPLLAERSLDFLLAKPAARSGFWQRWLDWTGS